jgi:hypothetical protein
VEEILSGRSLEAKFSAETATGVGKRTSAMLMYRGNKTNSLSDGDIQRIRDAWEKTIEAPTPRAASNRIRSSGAYNMMRDATDKRV